MTAPRETRLFPELQHLPPEEQRQRLDAAKQRAFGPDTGLRRWRGNLITFGAMFALCAVFMAVLVPALSLSRDMAAIFILVVVLPTCFILQQRRYVRTLRAALAEDETKEKSQQTGS